MNTQNARRHTTFFRVVSTFIFILLLLTSVSNSYADDEGLLGNLINQINTLIFGTNTSSSSDSSDNTPSDSTTTCATDPTPNPPPPPPPPVD